MVSLKQEVEIIKKELSKKEIELTKLRKELNNPASSKSLTNATATLVLGILSIPFMFCYGVPGIIIGIIALSVSSKDEKLLNTTPTKIYQNEAMHKAGRVCAKIGIYTPITIFLLIIFILILIL